MNVEVRVRFAHEAKTFPFTTWPLADLDGLISRMEGWGGVDECAVICGQFATNETSAYFELVIGE